MKNISNHHLDIFAICIFRIHGKFHIDGFYVVWFRSLVFCETFFFSTTIVEPLCQMWLNTTSSPSYVVFYIGVFMNKMLEQWCFMISLYDLPTDDCKLFPKSLITYPPQKQTYPYIIPENWWLVQISDDSFPFEHGPLFLGGCNCLVVVHCCFWFQLYGRRRKSFTEVLRGLRWKVGIWCSFTGTAGS